MDNIRIQTTQNVDIEYELASVGDRILATLLDYVFFIGWWLIIGFFFALSGADLDNSSAVITLVVLMFLPTLLYDLICEMVFQGKTFGKMIMKIKVVKLDGSQATFGAYLIRWILRMIDTRAFTPGVALVAILANERGQRIGDMAAGTTVIKMKQKVTLNDTILHRVRPDHTIVYPEVAKLSDHDVAIIKEVMQVAIRTGNHQAVEKLAAKIKSTMGINPQLPSTQFLNTVMQDYSHYNFDR